MSRLRQVLRVQEWCQEAWGKPVLRGEGGEHSHKSVEVWGSLRAGPWKRGGDRASGSRSPSPSRGMGTAWRQWVLQALVRACHRLRARLAGSAPKSRGASSPSTPNCSSGVRPPPCRPCPAALPSSSAHGPQPAASWARPAPDPGALQHWPRDCPSLDATAQPGAPVAPEEGNPRPP